MNTSKLKRIKDAADKKSQTLSGPLGFGFYDLDSGMSYYVNGDKCFPTASLFKVFVLAELYRKLGAGEISLNDRHALTDEMKAPGSGILFEMAEGTEYSLYDYAFLMMAISDNTAADFLYRFVGEENICKNVIEPMNLKKTKVNLTCADLFRYYCNIDPTLSPSEQIHLYYTGDYRNNDYYYCTQEKNDVTTPEEMSKFFSIIYNWEWYSKEISEKLLTLMKKCQTNSRIPKKLPAGTSVAHKTGSFDRLVCDSGIVYTEKGDYIITLMYNGNLADEEEYYIVNKGGFYGESLMAELSKEVYDIYTE